MRSFLASFKSNNQEDYSIVADRIRQTYDKWARIIDNVWIVNSDNPLTEIRAGISNIISEHNGIVLVVDITGDAWGTYSVDKEVTDWMKENIKV